MGHPVVLWTSCRGWHRVDFGYDAPELRHGALNALMTDDIPDDHVISRCPGVGQQPDQSDQNDPVTTAESNSAQRVPAIPLRHLFLKGSPNYVRHIVLLAEDVRDAYGTEVTWVEFRKHLSVPDLGQQPTKIVGDMSKNP